MPPGFTLARASASAAPHRLPETATFTPSSENTTAHARMMVSVSSLEASSYALTSSLEKGYVCATTEAKHSSSHRAASCAGTTTETKGVSFFFFFARSERSAFASSSTAARLAAAAFPAAARADARASSNDTEKRRVVLSASETETSFSFPSSSVREAPFVFASAFFLRFLSSATNGSNVFVSANEFHLGRSRSTATHPSRSNASRFTLTIPLAIKRGSRDRFVVPLCTSHGCSNATDPAAPTIWSTTPRRAFASFASLAECIERVASVSSTRYLSGRRPVFAASVTVSMAHALSSW